MISLYIFSVDVPPPLAYSDVFTKIIWRIIGTKKAMKVEGEVFPSLKKRRIST
jgi:hypothetical protein